MKNIALQVFFAPVLLGGFMLVAKPVPCQARGASHSLMELAKSADLIGFGNVTEARGDSVSVSIHEVLKGQKPQANVSIPTPPISPFDGGNPVYENGDSLLVFLVNKGGKYAMTRGSQSIIRVLTPEARDSYREAIELISEYEATPSSSTKVAKLGEMLRGKKASKVTALYLLAVEPRTTLNDALIQDVLPLTQDTDTGVAGQATQVLGRIATKEEIPALADLVASPNKHVRQAARIALRTLTGKEVSGKEDDADAKRKESVRKWKAWWTLNKDKVRLRK